jgi:hypothetical protein
MKLTGKDAATTLFTAVIIALYVAFLRGTDLPLISGVRGTTAVILVLGVVGGCALSGVGEVYSGPRSLPTRIFITIASTIGVLALTAGLVGLITGSETALGMLFGATVALWLIATTRHAFVGDRGPVAVRPPAVRPPAGHDGHRAGVG